MYSGFRSFSFWFSLGKKETRTYVLGHVFELEDFLSVECDVVGVDDLNFGEAATLLKQLLMVGVAEMN